MRTRFLSIDYFSSSSSFFNLPVPHLPPPSGISAECFLGFNSLPIIDIPLGIDRLKIETALAKLLADVIPDTIDVRRRSSEPALSSNEKDFENGTVEEATELIHEDEEAMENCRNCEPAVLDDQLSKCESKESAVDKSPESIELVQFEIPQLDMQLDNPLIYEKEYMDIFSQFSQFVNDMDTLNQVELHHNHETEESIYYLENIGLENLMEQKVDLVEDDCSVQGQQHFHFPLLEVDDISLGTLASMSMEDELTALLGKTEDQLLTQNEYFVIRGEHISKFLEDILLESASCDCLSNKCSEADLDSAEIFLEIDFLSVGETFFAQVNSSFYGGKQDGNCFLSFNPFVLEELQILDACPAPLFEVFGSSKFHKPGWEEMSKEKMSWKSFDELVVSRELALADGMFRSLPVPVLSSCKAVKKIYEISEKAFSSLKPQPLSTSDDIYLDWHLLEEEKCSSAMCSSFWNLIVAIDIQRIDFDWRTDSIAEVVLDFVLSEYDSGGLSFEECGKSPEVLFSGGDVLNGRVEDASSEHRIHTNQILLSEDNLKRNSSVFNSMSPFNDLDFFSHPSKAGTEKKNEHPTTNSNGTIDKVQYVNSLAACESADWQLQRKDFILHQVHLSEDLIAITENLKRSYLGVLESNVELKSLHSSFQEVDEFSLLSVPKQVLMDCIKNLGIQKPAFPGGVQMIITPATLCAVKQITWYLCFYGIQTAWSYLDKLCEGLDCLASRLRELKRFFVDKDGQPDVAKVSSHPSLSVIQDILLSRTTKNCLKVLVIADKVFWSSLKMLLTSMGISFCEMSESTQYPGSDLYGHGFFSVEKMKLLLAKDCLLASPKNISADFPFDKFEMIIEYGGHCDSSKIANLFPKLSGLPCHHFLRVEVNKSNVARALCKGVSVPQDTVMGMAGEIQNVKHNKECIDLSKLESLLNSVPLDDKVGSSEKEESCALPPIPSEPFSTETKDIQSGTMSFPELLIIMNTQSSEKEMIVSRRSTYQKILALEKDGAQVIERDSNLPADIIISPAVCLVWYECSNMLKKSIGSHGASSWLPCHVENIATNILNFLSFSFSCCILIFEGENRFLATIMESSDGLYAAAASLGIDLQLFCSYSAELTDEIILSCIDIGNRFIKGLFPKLPESETLAESFLCKFPSINPLIAHAIISNGGVLADFLEWSSESRINAVQKYHVSDESISLFSALCRYGEREDSQSIMTDSSSSVSSGPDSKNCHGSLGSENKRCKYMRSPHNMPLNNLLQFEPAKQSTDSILKCPELSKYSWESTKGKVSDPKGCESSLKDFLVEKEGLDSMMTRYPPLVTDPHDCNLSKDALLPNSSGKHSLRWNTASIGPKQGINEATMSSMEWLSSRNSDAVREEVRGEVVDLIEPAVFSPLNISFLVQDMDNDPVRESEYSFGQCNHPTFPTVAEIDSSSYCTSPLKHQKYSLIRGVDELLSQEQNNERLHLNCQRTLLNVDFDRRSSRKLPITTVPGKRPDRRVTPFTNALHSSHLQRGSPWTEEFLNQIRKKSMLRQRVLLPETSPCPNIRMNTPNRAKRRSPSILEFFKYQGSSTRKIPEQKRLKTSSQSLRSFKNEKAMSVGLSGTPADKRARRMLSYATNEASSQTKLVWSERNIDNRV